MQIDIIILSNAKNPLLAQMTQHTIDTCHRSEKDIRFNIVVLEQQPNVKYKKANTVFCTEPFNYNLYMNKGIAMTSNEYVCLCNNDLVFRDGWATKIVTAMESNYLLSASPLCPKTQGAMRDFKGPNVDFGYTNGKHLSGWCIMCNRFLFDVIGEISHDFPFWFADNEYAEQLKRHKVKHALVRDSWVEHRGSKTLNTEDDITKNKLTMGYVKKFIEMYPDNESSRYFKKLVK